MGCEIKLYNWVVLVALLSVSHVNNFVYGQPKVPCYFIFGDSLVDSGNNNNLNTANKVNYKPYGIDFPLGPTGRFCNGRTTADLLTEKLGFEEYIPSFLTANGSRILKGVNYASGAGGIRDETGKASGDCLSLNKQLEHHNTTISRIVKLLGTKEKANEHLQKCLYSITIGSNDYINNYFLPQLYNTSKIYTPNEYAKVLVDQYNAQIKRLYDYGARKVTLVGLGPIGCTPNATSYYGTGGSICVDKMNLAVEHFNARLRLLVHTLNRELQNASFMFANTLKFTPIKDFFHGRSLSVLQNGIDLGNHKPIINISIKCCDVGDVGLCIPNKPTCNNRNAILFWDSFHPTEFANRIQANVIFSNNNINHTYPIDLQRLLHIA